MKTRTWIIALGVCALLLVGIRLSSQTSQTLPQKTNQMNPDAEIGGTDGLTWFSNNDFSFRYPDTYESSGLVNNSVLLTTPTHMTGFADVRVMMLDKPVETEKVLLGEAHLISLHNANIAHKTAYEGVDRIGVNSYAILIGDDTRSVLITFNTGNKDTLGDNRANLTADQTTIINTFELH
jgi:hypothetical protein